MPIVPAPPGVAVQIQDSVPARFEPPSTANRHLIGFFDRGTVGQVSDLAAARALFGGHTNYSAAADSLAALLAIGVPTVNVARVTGPDPVAASVTIDAKLKVIAGSVGEWGNSLKAEITADGANRRLIITEAGAPVATSPAFADTATLRSWSLSDAAPVLSEVEIVAAGLPAATAATALAGGTDDRANAGPDDYAAALALLDRRFGPGHLLAPGVTDAAVHGLMLQHGDANNRNPWFDQELAVAEGDAVTDALALDADHGDFTKRGCMWASWAYGTPVGGEPERLIPWSVIQSAIASRVEQTAGFGVAPFGTVRGGAPEWVSRLAREWSTGYNPPGETQRLYAGRVNVAIDDGVTIAAEGYRTLDPDPLHEDLFAADTRMRLVFRAELIAKQYLGAPVNRKTLASYHGRLIALCEEFRAAGAFNDDRDLGYRVDVDAVNTPTTMANRELHGAIRYRPTGSVHWADLLVGARRPAETL